MSKIEINNPLKVNNEIELGNAIWLSEIGDTIILKSGNYGNIPIKEGVNYTFENNASASEILGLGIGGEEWSDSSVKIGDTSVIINPKIDKSNIKLYYFFQKKLPFNSRFEPLTSFVHANGVIIRIVGNDKEGFALEGNKSNAEIQLPKGVVDIIVPVLEEFDINKSSDNYLISIIKGDTTEEEKKKVLEIHQEEKAKKNDIEKNAFNSSIGLSLNDPEYKALWTLNSFIREYAKLTNEKKIKGYNILEFCDGLSFSIQKTLDEAFSFSPIQQVVGQYSNQKLQQNEVASLSNSFMSVEEYSISDFTEYHLNHLNYSFSTIGMYQDFESLWKAIAPSVYNTDHPTEKNKWKFIEHYTNDNDDKKYLAEMINARNNIIHSKKLKTFHSDEKGLENRLKTDWGSEELNDYEIFIKKRPWHWSKSLKKFKKAYNKTL